MRKLPPPAFGGIRQRYTRTSPGGVDRMVDPVRGSYCEFPDPLAYDNWLPQFIDPEVTSIRLGRDIPTYLHRAIHKFRCAQLYVHRDLGPVIHRIVDDPSVDPYTYFLPPGIRVEVRTRRQIRAYPITLRALDLARRTLTAHVDLPLDEESGLVDAVLAGNAERFRVREVLPSSAAHDKGSIDRILAAVLRAVVQGRCRIDWGKGPLNGSTVVNRARGPGDLCEAPSEERQASNDADQSSPVLPFAPVQGRRSSRRRA
jgi:hypothetical protein